MNKKHKHKVNPVLLLLVLIIIIGVVIAGVKLIEKYSPSKEKMNLTEYFHLENDDETAIIMQDEIIEDKGRIYDGAVYLSTDTIKQYLNDRFYWDSKENLYIYTLPTEMITAEVGSSDYTVAKQKQSMNNTIVKVDGETAYVLLDFVKLYTALDYEYNQEPNRVHIIKDYGDITLVDVKKDTQVRYKAGIKSPILTEVPKGEVLYVLKEEQEIDEWTRVRTASGFIGYVRDKKLGTQYASTTTTDFVKPEYTNISKDYTINMAWHQLDNISANDTVLSKIANTKGLTTISPTWFFISDNDGNIESLASQTYVNYCHQNDVEVWALVENIKYKESIDIVSILGRTSSRQKLVSQLVAQAIQYDIDGINVDIEALPTDAEEGYIEFVRELSIMCRLNGIVLSVDNYVPTESSDHYNRTEQGIVADYVVIMGYDEHYGGSEESGSVASIGFVRNGIEKTLESVPAEKIINAMPFYTRIWCTDENGAVTSKAKGMDAATADITDAGATAEWSNEAGQYYAEWEKDGNYYQVWLEEEKSIEEKVKLIKEYNLAGVSSWKLGFERADIWDIILKYVN